MFEWITKYFKRVKPTYDFNSLSFAIFEAKLAYPSMYSTTAQVINHLYLVIGNGYDWVNGGLAESYDDTKQGIVRKMLLAGKSIKKIEKAVAEEDHKRWKEMFADSDREYQKLRKKLGLKRIERETREPSKGVTPYPICEYSALCDIPPDAKHDWVAGAYEAARLAVVYDSYDPRQTAANYQWVAKAVERLDKMYGCLHRPVCSLRDMLLHDNVPGRMCK